MSVYIPDLTVKTTNIYVPNPSTLVAQHEAYSKYDEHTSLMKEKNKFNLIWRNSQYFIIHLQISTLYIICSSIKSIIINMWVGSFKHTICTNIIFIITLKTFYSQITIDGDNLQSVLFHIITCYITKSLCNTSFIIPQIMFCSKFTLLVW